MLSQWALILTEIARIRSAHQKHGKSFLDKIFTTEEQTYCLSKADPYPSLAARFAAKEAVSKALGTGFSEKFLLTSCSIKLGNDGEPSSGSGRKSAKTYS
jgi:holo-[acyl-carrier-protein] synthase